MNTKPRRGGDVNKNVKAQKMSQLQRSALNIIPFSTLLQYGLDGSFLAKRCGAVTLAIVISCFIAQTNAATTVTQPGQIDVSDLTEMQNDPPRKIFCQFNAKEYSPGDVWHPPVAIRSSVSICIRCTCLNTGRLNCSQEVCPSNCEDSNDPCCKTCSVVPNPTVTRDRSPEIFMPPQLAAVKQAGSKVSTEASSAGNSNEDAEEETEEEIVSCLHQGRIYRDREVFTANVSGLPIAAIDQCMQCQCQNGMVLCAMKSCSVIKCSVVDFTSTGPGSSDSCCHRCAAWKYSGGGQSSLQTSGDEVIQSRVLSNHVIKDASQQARNGDRTSGVNGGVTSETHFAASSIRQQQHQHRPEAQLQPLPSSSSVLMPIIISTLPVDSSVTFRDITSINSATVNGKTTQKPAEDCISSGIFYLHGSTWHPTIGPFGPMECVSCKCSHGQIECGRLKCPARRELPCGKPVKVEGHCCPICTSPNDKTFAEGTSLCVSAKQDITAFKSFGFGQNETEYIEFAFLRPRRITGGSEAQVERHEWKLLGVEIEEFTTQYLTPSQFESLKNRQGFTLLGATNEKNVEKFTRREKKLEKRCTSRCNVRISSLERSLRLHKLLERSRCLSHERMVHTV